eukprot:scaffold2243_cov165-Amphora_coffeaeformis.AAC.21
MTEEEKDVFEGNGSNVLIDGNRQDNDDDDGIWGSSEGYTPLAAWAQAGGGNGLFSMGPTNDSDEDEDGGEVRMGGGTFFANLQSFTVAASHPSDDDHENHQDNNDYQAVAAATTTASQTQDAEEAAFRALADQALLALEDDYRMTLQGEKTSFPSFPSYNGGNHNNHTTTTTTTTTVRQPRNTDPEFDDNDMIDPDLPPNFAADFDAARTKLTVSVAEEEVAFKADFDNVPPQKELPDIDTDKVRQAVQTLNLRLTGLDKKMASWERLQQRQATIPPLRHPWIPENVCRTFRKQKSPSQTQTWSRAATLAHAWDRLHLESTSSPDHPWVVHILGCDHVEASSQEQLVNTFGHLVTWMQEHARKPPRSIQLTLIGPSLPTVEDSSQIELVVEGTKRSDCRLESVKLKCHTAYYHEWRKDNASDIPPDLLLAFHPGFWGYDTWKPTLDWLVEKGDKVPLVATSYTLLEAEEDQEVLKGMSAGTMLWEAEYNPFASQKNRATATAVEGEEYRENSAWQAWRF